MRIKTSRSQRSLTRRRRDPKWRPSFLHEFRPDKHVFGLVSFAAKAEPFAAETTCEDFEALVRARDPMRDRIAIAREVPRHITEANPDIDASPAEIVEHRQILRQSHGMIERQDGDVGGEADPIGARGHGAGDGNPGWQKAVVDEVMFGKPDQVEAEPFEPNRRVEQFGIEAGIIDPRLGCVAEIVDHADAEFWPHNSISPGLACGRSTVP